MPQGKSDTGLLVLGGALLLFLLFRKNGGFLRAGEAAFPVGPESEPVSISGPPAQPFQPALRLGPTGGIVPFEGEPVMDTRIIRGQPEVQAVVQQVPQVQEVFRTVYRAGGQFGTVVRQLLVPPPRVFRREREIGGRR